MMRGFIFLLYDNESEMRDNIVATLSQPLQGLSWTIFLIDKNHDIINIKQDAL